MFSPQRAGALADALVLDHGGLGGERGDDPPFAIADGQHLSQDRDAADDGALHVVARPPVVQHLGDRADLLRTQPPARQRVLVERRDRARLGVGEHLHVRAGPREQEHVRVEQVREEVQIGNDALDQGGGDAVETARDIARDRHRLRSERPTACVRHPRAGACVGRRERQPDLANLHYQSSVTRL
jgi:hypothetical protein